MWEIGQIIIHRTAIAHKLHQFELHAIVYAIVLVRHNLSAIESAYSMNKNFRKKLDDMLGLEKWQFMII